MSCIHPEYTGMDKDVECFSIPVRGINNFGDRNSTSGSTRFTGLYFSVRKPWRIIIGSAKLILSLFILSYSFSCSAQDVAINTVELKNGMVVLHYNLLDSNTEHQYTLRLYSSKDNFVQPLEKVAGDIGVAVPVGGNKTITWDARAELDSGFDGSVSLQLKGQIYTPFITLSHFEDIGTFKRGRPYELTWSGGRGDNVMNFDLYRGDEKVWTQANVANSGNLTLVIPTNVKPGKKYVFRISDAKNPDEVVYTVQFQIKRKIPLGVKVAAGLVVVGAVGYIVSTSSGGTSGEPKIEEPPLPTR